MRTTYRCYVAIAMLLGLSSVAFAQASASKSDDATAASSPGAKPVKKSRLHAMKKPRPNSVKADADSVSNGAPGDNAKGGQ